MARLSEEEARTLYRQGEEAVVFALLKLSKERAELNWRSAWGGNREPEPRHLRAW